MPLDMDGTLACLPTLEEFSSGPVWSLKSIPNLVGAGWFFPGEAWQGLGGPSRMPESLWLKTHRGRFRVTSKGLLHLQVFPRLPEMSSNPNASGSQNGTMETLEKNFFVSTDCKYPTSRFILEPDGQVSKAVPVQFCTRFGVRTSTC